MDDEYDLKSGVKFNAGFFQIQRIHEVQRMINICKINPTSFNADYNIWNYQLWLNCLNTLLDEIWPKLKDGDPTDDDKDKVLGEKGQANAVRMKMLVMIDRMPVVENKYSEYNDKTVSVVNNKKWVVVHQALIHYDNYIKELMNSHGWNNPDGDYEAADEY